MNKSDAAPSTMVAYDVQREERILNSINKILQSPSPKAHGQTIAMWLNLIGSPGFKCGSTPEQLNFIFTFLLPAAFNKDVSKEALNAIKLTLPHLLKIEYREHPKYKEFLEKAIKVYMPKLKLQIEDTPDWAVIWCAYLSVLRKDLARSIQINSFLAVAECGFRSVNIEMRTKAFICWKKLIEVFANEGQLAQTKRVKLIVVPLQTTASKNLELATVKFNCWWHLINSIVPESSEDHTRCFLNFLSFCFGPFDEVPLSGYLNSSSTVSPGKLYNELKLSVVVALIRLTGPIVPEVANVKLDRAMDSLKAIMDPVKTYGTCRMEMIYSCAEATVLVYSVHRLTAGQQAALTKNIWDNLFALMKADEKLSKSILLATQAISALVNLSVDSQRRSVTPAIKIILDSWNSAGFAPKGVQSLTEYAQVVVRMLHVTTKIWQEDQVEAAFHGIIMTPFRSMIMDENKTAFIQSIVNELTKYPETSSFAMWSIVWRNLIVTVLKNQAMVIEFLKFGLEHHFDEMLKNKDMWICVGKSWSVNQYLNMVSQLFQDAVKDKALSIHVVEVVASIMRTTVNVYDKFNIPKEVFTMFNAQVERLVFTEFVDTFMDALNSFLKDIKLAPLILIITELKDTLKIFSKVKHTTEECAKLKATLREKTKLIETSSNDACKAFLLLHLAWINQGAPKTPQSASKKMAPPKRKEDEDFVPIKKDFIFDPKQLTEHQIEKLKQRRDDIPALYNDNSQSQDTRSLQPWALKTTPAAAVSENKTNANEPSAFSAVTNPNPTTTPAPTEAVTMTPVAAELNTSRAGTPTRKKLLRERELSRLTIDTVEGQSIFDDGKKTRRSRRESLDVKAKESPKTSPKKNQNGVEKVKARRNTMNGDSKNKTLKPVPEGTVQTNEKLETKKVPRETPVIVENPPAVESEPKEHATPPPAEGECVDQVVVKQEKPVVQPPQQSMVVIPVEMDVDKAPPSPKVSVIKEVPKESQETPLAISEPVPDTIPEATEPETLPEVAEPETEESPMEVAGSESFVEEMNLAISTNSSVNQQRSIVSSPEDLDNADERESTFLNDTVNISPILKDVTQKETIAPVQVPVKVTITAEPQKTVADVMTTPKRSTDGVVMKENKPTPVSTTPQFFTGRGAQMLQQTKLFQESTPKERPRDATPVINKEETLKRMLHNTAPPKISSPSTSILRRKLDDLDDTIESPAAKKKRVSFSDPPVSATKEFERDHPDQSCSRTIKFNRMMRTSRNHSASNLHILKLERDAMACGSYSDDEDGEPVSNGTRAPAAEPPVLDDAKIIEYLRRRNLELSSGGNATDPMPLSQIRTLTEILMHSIAKNEGAKEEFFQRLMMEMPKETLHWAVKENSSYQYLNEVKEQVGTGTMANYLISLIKTDDGVAQKMAKDMGARMDPEQKLRFISTLSAVDHPVVERK